MPSVPEPALSTERIVAMVDELIEAHGDLIPEGIRRG
jgi:alpha-galactosidase/6-phospho-beta-glucosidase family protein